MTNCIFPIAQWNDKDVTLFVFYFHKPLSFSIDNASFNTFPPQSLLSSTISYVLAFGLLGLYDLILLRRFVKEFVDLAPPLRSIILCSKYLASALVELLSNMVNCSKRDLPGVFTWLFKRVGVSPRPTLIIFFPSCSTYNHACNSYRNATHAHSGWSVHNLKPESLIIFYIGRRSHNTKNLSPKSNIFIRFLF